LFLSRRTVGKCVEALVQAGLIESFQERQPNGKFWRICYRLKTPLLDDEGDGDFPRWLMDDEDEEEENHAELKETEEDEKTTALKEENPFDDVEKTGPADAKKLRNGCDLRHKPVDNLSPVRKNCATDGLADAKKVRNGENAEKSRVSANGEKRKPDAKKVRNGENP